MSDLVLTSPDGFNSKHARFRDWIFRAFRWRFECDPRWGPADAKQLDNLLKENPSITEKEFCLALKNILQSDDVPERQSPRFWLPRLESYVNHSHNTFGRKPNAQIDTAQTQRKTRNQLAFEQARKSRQVAGGNDRNLALEGTVGRRNTTLASGLRALSDGSD